MKKIILVFLFSFLIAFSGCGQQLEEVVTTSSTVVPYGTSYVVVPLKSSPLTVYGTVIVDTIKTISSNKGGILSYVDCQPGKEVTKDTIVAKIQVNTADVAYQNGQVQLQSLQNQLTNVLKLYSLTQDTLVLQKNILYDQYQNNLTMIDAIEQSESYTDSSLDYQKQLLYQQYATIKESTSIDTDKMKTSIANAHKQYLIVVKDALKKVDDVFSRDVLSISDQDFRLKQEVLSEYTRLNAKLTHSMSPSQFSQYLLDMSELMLLAARSAHATTATTMLPKSSSVGGISIDALYTTFTTLATTFIGSKSAFDTLISSYDSVKNTYNSQLISSQLNLDNFTENTQKSTILSLSNQKSNLLLAQKNIQMQMDASDNNQTIQLVGIKNQILTLQQNIAVLSNSLDGEVLYAGVDGVVKMKMVGEDNKIAPGTPLCQIAPKDELNMSIQVFSYQRLPLGTRVAISTQQGQPLVTGILLYEYPYRDFATQNYIYEIPVVRAAVKENERVLVSLSQAVDNKEVRIPLSYVSPRLEGYLVRAKTVNGGIKDLYVQLGPINDGYVQVLSGLNMGNEIVK